MDSVERFFKLLDDLEDNLDKGFFLSFIGKIIVDEKKIYSVLNELRSLAPAGLKEMATRAAPPPPPPPSPALVQPVAPPLYAVQSISPAGAHDIISNAEQQAAAMKQGADRYADEVLSDLEERLATLMGSIREGRRVLKTRTGSEVTPDATAQI
jgi:hypothetical protein